MKFVIMLGALLGSVSAAATWQDGTVVPLTLYDAKQLTIEAVVAGHRRTFLFDTGEGVTMISPALAKLDSSAAAPRRSKTVTSWPSKASSYAVVIPTIPAPTTAIFCKFIII